MVEKKATTKTAAKKTATKKATAAKTATATKKTSTAKKEVIYLTAENAGFRAGDVYQALAAAEQSLSLEEVAKQAKISVEDAILGIGWLFKEGKIKDEDNKVDRADRPGHGHLGYRLCRRGHRRGRAAQSGAAAAGRC